MSGENIKKVVPPAIFFVDDNVFFMRNGKQIGTFSEEKREVRLQIGPNHLVTNDWTRKDFVALFRSYNKILKEVKKRGYWCFGGIWFPNLEKVTLHAIYDDNLKSLDKVEPKAPRKPRKPLVGPQMAIVKI